ncbi:MAG: lipoate--protein ligase [Treponema sp.]|jgi:lipoate-protein ligase A|nr:lipoate--protein ligase [Treponema sp.]
MINETSIFITEETNPYKNIALEALLLETLPDGAAALYLWQNRRTVVIGRNQNAWKECRVEVLERDGGFLARRLSGGGAVFHDMGNLNFTFLVPKGDYNLDKQTDVILQAVRNVGVKAQKNGRNDLETDGRKFSGNAYYQSGKNAFHHGTLLVNADMDAASKYLSVSQDKIKAKSVESVRQRVINLTECAPDLTISTLKTALVEAFDAVYKRRSARLTLDSAADEFFGAVNAPCMPHSPNHAAFLERLRRRLSCLEKQFADPAWKYGKNPPFTSASSGRFPWGGVEVALNVERNTVTEAAVFSDAMDETFVLELALCLKGVDFTRTAVFEALTARFADNPLRLASCADVVDLIFGDR